MHWFKKIGIFLGSLHVVLYFVVPVYGSYLDKIAPPLICLPTMFFFGFWWPQLCFYAFAPARFYQDPGAQRFIREIGRVFQVPIGKLALRIISLILLWPFSIMNFLVLYHGLQE